MYLRAALAASILSLMVSNSASAQNACVVADFTASCNVDGTIQICDATDAAAPVEKAITCTEGFGLPNDGACTAAIGCVGACADIGLGCEAPVDGACIGFSPLTNQDEADNDAAGSVMCAGDATCQLNADGSGDTCVAHVGPACAPGAQGACVGNVAVLCLGDAADTLALTSNIAIDCALFNTTCGPSTCECDEQCGEGATCNNGICDTGDFCVFASDVVCPTGGEGEGEGEGEGSSRDDEVEPAPSGCPFNAAGSFPAFGALALLVAGLRRRRA